MYNLINNRYRKQKVIGQGGQAVVCLAIDEKFNRECAIKVISGYYKENKQEAKILSKLDIKGIPKVYDMFTIGNILYIVIEYINGRDLEGKKFNKKEAYDLLFELLFIVYDLHNEGIIHGDIKPANLLIAKNQLYLIDFGLSKKTQTVLVGHTPQYAAPEQLSLKTRSVQTDIYNIGATFQELYSFTDPILAKATEIDVRNRYKTVEEFLRAVTEERNKLNKSKPNTRNKSKPNTRNKSKPNTRNKSKPNTLNKNKQQKQEVKQQKGDWYYLIVYGIMALLIFSCVFGVSCYRMLP